MKENNITHKNRPDLFGYAVLTLAVVLGMQTWLTHRQSPAVATTNPPEIQSTHGIPTLPLLAQFRETLQSDATVDLESLSVAPAASTSPAPKTTPPVRGKRAERIYHPIVVKTASQYEIDPALIKAIIFAESGFDPLAISRRGAVGLMQLMPATAEAMGVKNRFDPAHNIAGGVKYFKMLVTRFQGDIRLALAAYNAGSKTVRRYNGVPPYEATQKYIVKVLEYYKKYQQQLDQA